MAKNHFNLSDQIDGFLRTPEETEGASVDIALHVRLHRLLFLLLPTLAVSGFQFSPDRVIRLNRLLALLPSITDGAVLGQVLGPIFATNPKQQADFFTLFQQIYEQVLARESAEKVTAEKQEAREDVNTVEPNAKVTHPSKIEDRSEDLADISKQGLKTNLTEPLSTSDRPLLSTHRPLVIELDRCTDPPYTWNIVPDDDEVAVETGDTFGQTLLRLRRREVSDTEMLDIAGTIEATIENGGRYELRYRSYTRPTEYLLLVERFSAEDHRAGLFDYFFQTLRANEVLVDRFFYQGDLRICRNEQHPAGLNLSQLRYRYPDSRLLVVGTGYRLLSQATGELAEWAEPLLSWHIRVLLTPVAHATWAQREQKLAEVFSLLPASLQSLHFVAESPEEATGGQYDALPGYIRRIAEAQPLVLGKSVLRCLRQHFDSGLMAWIAACAVYPALHFDLTLRLGRLTSEALDYNLVTAANLIALSRLPWFTAGQIPSEARSELVGFLEARHPALHSRVIEYIHVLLERNPPPENSAAWAEHRINLALLTVLRDEQPNALLLDELRAVVKRLDRPERREDFVLPRAWEKMLDRLGLKISSISEDSESVEIVDLSLLQAKDWFEKEMQKGEIDKALMVLAKWLKTSPSNSDQVDNWKTEVNMLRDQLLKIERDVSTGKIKGEDTSKEYGLLVVRIFNFESNLWKEEAIRDRTAWVMACKNNSLNAYETYLEDGFTLYKTDAEQQVKILKMLVDEVQKATKKVQAKRQTREEFPVKDAKKLRDVSKPKGMSAEHMAKIREARMAKRAADIAAGLIPPPKPTVERKANVSKLSRAEILAKARATRMAKEERSAKKPSDVPKPRGMSAEHMAKIREARMAKRAADIAAGSQPPPKPTVERNANVPKLSRAEILAKARAARAKDLSNKKTEDNATQNPGDVSKPRGMSAEHMAKIREARMAKRAADAAAGFQPPLKPNVERDVNVPKLSRAEILAKARAARADYLFAKKTEEEKNAEVDSLRNLGQYEKARGLLETALASDLKNFGPQHPNVALRQSKLANVYLDLRQYDKARDLLEATLASDLKNFDTAHPNVAVSQLSLANVYSDLGQYEKARDLLETALISNLKNFGQEHPTVSVNQSNLANVYSDLGQYEKARDLLETALSSDLKNFGLEHTNVALRQSNLANVYRNLGQYKKACDLLETALASDQKNFGSEHPAVAVRQSNLATVYCDLGQYEKARDLLEATLAFDLKNFGPQHPAIAVRQSNLATVYQNLGQYEKARDLFEASLSFDLKNFGPEHPTIALRQINLGAAFYHMGEKEKARQLFQQGYELSKKQFGEQHTSTKTAKEWLDKTDV